MRLSYSTMRLLHECPHNYLNKISDIPQPSNKYFEEGKEAHGILQKHLSGVEVREDLSHLKFHFPIVEKIDSDPDTKFLVPLGNDLEFIDKSAVCLCDFPVNADGTCEKCRKPIPPYIIFGFFDGLNLEKGQLLEIKTSSTLWSLGKFKNLVQRKIYGWAMPELTEAILITSARDPGQWQYQPPKAIRVPFTQEDKNDAYDWITKSIQMIQNGDFTGDLVNGKCVDPRCYWGDACMFK